MNPSSEQRQSRRVPIAYKVRLVAEDQMISFASALNLSMGGILLGGPGQLPVGSHCGVAILLADGGTGGRIVARGRVVRSDAQGLAIAFSRALERSSEDALRSLIRSLDPEAVGLGQEPGFEVLDAGS
jgi:hypothetical protein